jgi:hypothetical protein
MIDFTSRNCGFHHQKLDPFFADLWISAVICQQRLIAATSKEDYDREVGIGQAIWQWNRPRIPRIPWIAWVH